VDQIGIDELADGIGDIVKRLRPLQGKGLPDALGLVSPVADQVLEGDDNPRLCAGMAFRIERVRQPRQRRRRGAQPISPCQ
jgi:hypothetical protein